MSSSASARSARAQQRAGGGGSGDNEWQSTVVLDPLCRRHARPVQRWRSIDDMRENTRRLPSTPTDNSTSIIIKQPNANINSFYDSTDIGAVTHLAPILLYVNHKIFQQSSVTLTESSVSVMMSVFWNERTVSEAESLLIIMAVYN